MLQAQPVLLVAKAKLVRLDRQEVPVLPALQGLQEPIAQYLVQLDRPVQRALQAPQGRLEQHQLCLDLPVQLALREPLALPDQLVQQEQLEQLALQDLPVLQVQQVLPDQQAPLVLLVRQGQQAHQILQWSYSAPTRR